jgi:hypothetical protein
MPIYLGGHRLACVELTPQLPTNALHSAYPAVSGLPDKVKSAGIATAPPQAEATHLEGGPHNGLRASSF